MIISDDDQLQLVASYHNSDRVRSGSLPGASIVLVSA